MTIYLKITENEHDRSNGFINSSKKYSLQLHSVNVVELFFPGMFSISII